MLSFSFGDSEQTVSSLTPAEFDFLPDYVQNLILDHRHLPEVTREEVEQQLLAYWNLFTEEHKLDCEAKEDARLRERDQSETGNEPSVHRFEDGGECERRHESNEIHITENLASTGRQDGRENCIAQHSDSLLLEECDNV